MGAGPTLHWRRRWWNLASRISGSPPRGGRIRYRGILRCDQSWIYVSGTIGGQERGCLGGGENWPEKTWRGRRKGRRRQRQKRIQSQTQNWSERIQVEQAGRVERSEVKRKGECPLMDNGPQLRKGETK